MPLLFVFLLVGFVLMPFVIGVFPKTCSASSAFSLDFTTLPEDARNGLSSHGFSLEQQMGDEKVIRLSAENGRLAIVTSGPALGCMVKKDLQITKPEILEIVWGVERYPQGGDWRRGSKKEAVMVVLFFGAPLPGGSFYLPDIPMFLGMFLGEHDPPLQPFISDNYGDTGRYVCMGNPPSGRTITTRLDLRDAFRDWFGGRAIPPLTGIAIEVDTGDLPEEDASSSAFIHHIGLNKAD